MSGRTWRRFRVTLAALATIVVPGLVVTIFPDLGGYGGVAFGDCQGGCPRCYRPPAPLRPQEAGTATPSDERTPTDEPGTAGETGTPGDPPDVTRRPRVPDAVNRPRVDPNLGQRPGSRKY